MATAIAYKLVRIRNGKLYPLYVFSNEEFKVGEWLMAKPGIRLETGKVKSKLGPLAYRPGFHLTVIPYAGHIGKRVNGELVQAKDTVWVEAEYHTDISYQKLAENNGRNKNGKVVASMACLKSVPENGFYKYKTNPQAKVDWLIAGEMKITRILSNQEVNSLCREYGIEPQTLEAA